MLSSVCKNVKLSKRVFKLNKKVKKIVRIKLKKKKKKLVAISMLIFYKLLEATSWKNQF